MAQPRGSILTAVLAALWGVFLGVGVFTFGYARGGSYLTDDPAACANCHVMRDQYAGWMKASHRKAAVCNDCHAPAGPLAKYATKAINGFFHSWAFTTGLFPDRIQITGRNFRVTEGACLKCHAEITAGFATHRERTGCLNCHAGVGHMN
ncbi:MAG: cytochrome c nitrite reductase small subunit [Bryobacteraceae bacterium]|nr:cytochrome c nitrite reductase small subunit [Bryobacteraceae bacterium]